MNKSKYQIFCDLDCVLVDLYKGVENEIKKLDPTDLVRIEMGEEELSGKHLSKDNESFKPKVHKFFRSTLYGNRKFWMNLPWMQEGKDLWNAIRDHDPIILSKPTDLDSVIGKKAWLKRNLGIPHHRILIRHNKSKYASFEGKCGLLIDDYESNIKAFRNAGGKAIHYRELNDALRGLKKYGFRHTT